MPVEPDLAELATAHGIAVRYRDSSEREVELDRDVVIDVLQALEVDASTPSALASALDAVRGADPEALPATVVVDEGHERALPSAGVVTLEDGAVREVGTTLPTDLPVGYHRLACRGQDVTLIVAPPPLTPPPATWGWMAQLYALRSAGLVGLRRLRRPRHAARADGRGAGRRRAAGEPAARTRAGPACRGLAVLAVEPAVPAPALHPRRRHRGLRGGAGVGPGRGGRAASRRRRARRPRRGVGGQGRGAGAAAPVRPGGAVGRRGPRGGCSGTSPPGTRWPSATAATCGRGRRVCGHVGDSGVPDARAELADRVLFHAWCLDLADAQLAAAHRAAEGMAVGLIADLAVGCSSGAPTPGRWPTRSRPG